MQKKIIFVFHNGRKDGGLTYDCRLRVETAKLLAQKDAGAAVVFVGGGGISGAREMQKFWKKSYAKLSNKTYFLENANNTANGVKEIAKYIKNDAEDVLLKKDDFEREIKKYRKSWLYFFKKMAELILGAYIWFDADEKAVEFMRGHAREHRRLCKKVTA